jgi:hypothetical protein
VNETAEEKRDSLMFAMPQREPAHQGRAKGGDHQKQPKDDQRDDQLRRSSKCTVDESSASLPGIEGMQSCCRLKNNVRAALGRA